MWRVIRATAMFQLSGPSDRIGTSRNATTVPIAVAAAKASIAPEDVQRWHATHTAQEDNRQARTRSEQEGRQQRAGGAEHAAAAAAQVGAEEQQRDGQRQQVVERHAVGRGDVAPAATTPALLAARPSSKLTRAPVSAFPTGLRFSDQAPSAAVLRRKVQLPQWSDAGTRGARP